MGTATDSFTDLSVGPGAGGASTQASRCAGDWYCAATREASCGPCDSEVLRRLLAACAEVQ